MKDSLYLHEHPDRLTQDEREGVDIARKCLAIAIHNGRCPICLANEWLVQEVGKTKWVRGGRLASERLK